MPPRSQRRSSAEKVRARLRAQGLRPIQIRMSDVGSPLFEAEAHRQSMAIAQSAHAGEDQTFIHAVSELPDA